MAKTKSKYKVEKPNPLIYFMLKVGSFFMARIMFNIKLIKNEAKKAKKPYVVIQNHESVIDFYTSYAYIKPTSHVVISNSFYQVSKIRNCMRLSGVIPKQQFQTSIADLKLMKSSLEVNRPLVFYPQGLMTEDGISTIVPTATGKALKWFRQDVYFLKVTGTYFTSPKWSKIKRRGKPNAEMIKLFSKEELEELTHEEIEKIVEEKLSFDAYRDQEKRMIKYKKGDLIEGLHFPLYKCPKCGKEFTMETEENHIFCRNCGNIGYADKYGFLHPESDSDVIYKLPSDWSRFIQRGIEEEIRKDEEYSLNDKSKVYKLNYEKHEFEYIGEYNVSLLKNEFLLESIDNGGLFDIKSFDNTNLYLTPYASGEYFELQDGLDIYRVYLSNGKEVSKWMNVLKVKYRIRNNITLK